jgi:hypothetical protein
MGTFSHTYTMGPPNALDRIAYRRRYTELPWSLTHVGLMTVLVLMLPVSWRWLNRWYATYFRYFWMPCPRCGREFGGHEMGRTMWGLTHDENNHLVTAPSYSGTNVCRYCSHEIQTMEDINSDGR